MATLFLETLIRIVCMPADGISSLHFFLKGSWVMVSKGLEGGDLSSEKMIVKRDMKARRYSRHVSWFGSAVLMPNMAER